jgi:hypothetical protein
MAYRALEGPADARATLWAGFTTVRDVESEWSGYADVALRNAINAGLVQGTRMLVATREIAAVGQYPPFNVCPDLVGFPTAAQMGERIENIGPAQTVIAHAPTDATVIDRDGQALRRLG